jgi:hypothetical protein
MCGQSMRMLSNLPYSGTSIIASLLRSSGMLRLAQLLQCLKARAVSRSRPVYVLRRVVSSKRPAQARLLLSSHQDRTVLELGCMRSQRNHDTAGFKRREPSRACILLRVYCTHVSEALGSGVHNLLMS